MFLAKSFSYLGRNCLSTFDYLRSYYNGQYQSPSLGIYLGQVLLGSYRLSFNINTFIFLGVSIVLLFKFFFSKTGYKELVFFSFLLYWVYLLTKLSLVLTWYLTPLIALGSLCASWGNYRKIALGSLVFTSIYSLAIFYFVR